jgi:gentisate 1,2-dioxygenase
MEHVMATVKAKEPDQGVPDRKHNIEAMRQDYYGRVSRHGMTPLWKVMGTLFRDEPVSRCAPAVWHFDDVKSLVMEAGGLITAEEAKRRVLILENPALRGESRVTNTLFAGIQMIMPGEIAPAHRHVSSAIRFVLDGEGAYTAVEGEKAFMSPGDFVITANWRRTITATRRINRCCGSTCSTPRRSISTKPRSVRISAAQRRRPRGEMGIR